ncbi:UNVERIFIED_CONTAM: hypothetical protein Scaly_2926400 [Sesamum calycinum]|uniref:Reverse transcriptase zinc-binding domain-containing protein n=1 Tax=Sesamum calycinum TaxID=2727403 RepID=A0AAW2KTY5_9LAMI
MSVNEMWLETWPDSSYISSLPSTLDHSPLIINGTHRGAEHVIFRFDNYLTQQSSFLDSVYGIWRHRITGTSIYEVVYKLKALKNVFRQQRAVQQERQQIIDFLGFQAGSLPVKYLGVPLTSSRLTLAYCRPLNGHSFGRLESYAGRLQLIRSVLSTLHTYWASVFILPKGILKVIEGKMRKFLWQGLSGRGTAKVAWEQICKPKDEGGLGIRSTLASNQALMLKHLWRILQNDGTSI